MHMVVRFLKAFLLTVFIAVCLGYLAIRYVLWPQLPTFKDNIAGRLSQVLHQTVSIDSVQTSWDRFMPSARLLGVQVGKDLTISDLEATVSWRSLTAAAPILANVVIRSPNINVQRVAEKKLIVAGFDIDLSGPEQEPKALNLLLDQRHIEITGASIRWVDTYGGMAPLSLSGLGLIMENSGRSHKISTQAKVTEIQEANLKLAVAPVVDQLQLRGDFIRPIGSRKTDFKNWQGNAYFDFDQLRWSLLLPHLKALAPPELKPKLGVLTQATGNAKMWLKVQERPELFVSTQFNDVTLALGQANAGTAPNKPLQLRRATASGQFNFAPNWDNGDIQMSQLQLDSIASNGLVLKTTKPVDLALNTVTGALSTQLQVEPIKIELLSLLLTHVGLPQPTLDKLQARAATGLISNAQFSWQQTSRDAPASWTMMADIKDATSKPGVAPENRLGLPGFRGLSGSLNLSDKGGQLSVVGGRSQLSFPGLFVDDTVSLNQIKGAITWQTVKGQTLVNINELNFANDDGSGQATGTYQTGGKGGGIVDIKGKLESVAVTRIPRYIPKPISSVVREWLATAMRTGQVKEANFSVKGDLYDFPYRKPTQGQFLVATKMQGVTLAYSPEFPEITDMQGDLILDGPGLSFKMQQGKSSGIALSQVEGKIADFADSELVIEGRGNGLAQNMVAFVNASPIKTRIDNFTAETKISGEAQLDLKLRLPFKDLSLTKVDGIVTLSKSDVFVDSTLPSFGGVSGQMKFGEAGFSLNDMVGTFAGGPIKVNTAPNGPGRMTIRAEGKMEAEGLRGFSNNPMTQKLSGSANYKALIDVQGKFSTVNIESDLIGLASALPAPFAKLAETRLPLKIKTVPNPVKVSGDRPEGDVFSAKIGDDIAVLFDRRRDPKTQRMEIFRGSFGVKLEPELPESGFSLAVNTDRLDVEQWTPILLGFAAAKDPTGQAPESVSGFAEGFSLLPSLVTIVANQVKVGSREFTNVVLGATRLEGYWRANGSAKEIAGGYFTWRDAKPGQAVGTLTARFNRLTIPKASVTDVENLLSKGPEVLPGLDIAADEFSFGGTNFGKLELMADNTGSASLPIWSIQALTLTNPHAQFKATGRWAPGQGEFGAAARATELDFKIDIADSGGLLDLLGVKKAVKNAPGKLGGKVRWTGAPWGIDYDTLAGDIDIELSKGQFLKVDAGAAKLISVLNLQSLPKRLTLDFSDLVDEGFAFDQVRGQATITSGVLRTTNMEINGPQAKVTIVGSADIARETQDLSVKVRPEINAGLASLAYVAINPAIGLGTLLAQTLFRKPLQEAFAVELDVRGSWVEPKVEQRKRTPIAPVQNDGSGQ
jgi:uncharacterized protein (TIGR02099 family)